MECQFPFKITASISEGCTGWYLKKELQLVKFRVLNKCQSKNMLWRWAYGIFI